MFTLSPNLITNLGQYGMGGEPKKGGLRGARPKGTNTPGGGAG